MMKSKETMVMRPISSEVQRGFLADLGGLVSVILRSLPAATGCNNSPEETETQKDQERERDGGLNRKKSDNQLIIIPSFSDSFHCRINHFHLKDCWLDET